MSTNKETKTSVCEIKVTSTPSKGGSEPPTKTKRTISEVSESSAEELIESAVRAFDK